MLSINCFFQTNSSSAPARITNPTIVVIAKIPTNKNTIFTSPYWKTPINTSIVSCFLRGNYDFYHTYYRILIGNYNFVIAFKTISVECFAATGKNSSKLIFDCFPAISDSARITTKGVLNW